MAAFLQVHEMLLDAVVQLFAVLPWMAPLVTFAPALAGLVRGSLTGTVGAGLLGFLGVPGVYFGLWWGIFLWAIAWLVGGWLAARSRSAPR
jgi:hypothetical protein